MTPDGPATAEERLDALGALLGRVTHDLRTPITIISGFVDTLLNFGADIDDEQRKQMLERVKRAAERLDGLVDELVVATQPEPPAD